MPSCLITPRCSTTFISLLLVALLAACDTGVQDDSTALTDTDARLMASLTAQSLGDRTGGFLMAVHDLKAGVGPDTLIHGPSLERPPAGVRDRSWRGAVKAYEVTDVEDHRRDVRFQRAGDEMGFSASLQADLSYEFDHASDISVPVAERESSASPLRLDGQYEGQWRQENMLTGDIAGISAFDQRAALRLRTDTDPLEMQAVLRREATDTLAAHSEGQPILAYQINLQSVDLTINRQERHVGVNALAPRMDGVLEVRVSAEIIEPDEQRALEVTGRVTIDAERARLQFDDSPDTFTLDLDSGVALPY